MLSEAEVLATFPNARKFETDGLTVWYVRPSRQAWREYKPLLAPVAGAKPIPEGKWAEAQKAHETAADKFVKSCVKSHNPGEVEDLLDEHPMLIDALAGKLVDWLMGGGGVGGDAAPKAGST